MKDVTIAYRGKDQVETHVPLHGEDIKALARNGYNASAQRYFDWNSSLPSPRLEWLDKCFLHVQAASNTVSPVWSNLYALELGCGAGVPTTLKLAQVCKHVTGVDISSAQLGIARTKFEDAGVLEDKYELREADMAALTFPESSFDGICAFYSIIHLPLQEQRAVLEKMHTWLKPGGFTLFNVGAQASGEDGEVEEDWLGMRAFWASYGTEGILKIVKEIGFGIVECDTVQIEGDAAFTWIIARKPEI